MAAKKKAVAKKAVRKSSAKKVAIKRTAKKSATKKSTVKKSAVKKASKKSAVRKKPVKKVAKRSAKLNLASIGISEADYASLQERTQGYARATAKAPATKPVEAKKSRSASRNFIFLGFVLLLVVGFLISNNKKSETVVTPRPTPVASETSSPTPTPVESKAPATPTINLFSSFTATGTKISWRTSVTAVTYVLKIEASESQEARVLTLDGATRTRSFDKQDTVGSTKFTIVAKLGDGTSIKSTPLILNGQY